MKSGIFAKLAKDQWSYFSNVIAQTDTDTTKTLSYPHVQEIKIPKFSVLEPAEKKQVEIDPDSLLDKVPPILAMEKPYQLNIELDSFTLAWQPAIYPSGAKQVPIK